MGISEKSPTITPITPRTSAPAPPSVDYIHYNTLCVDLLHEATTTYTHLATPTPPLTSTYTGSSVTNPGTSATAFGWAAWLVNTYNSTATTMDQQAGLQIAIWKVLYETTRTATALESLGTGAIQSSNNINAISYAYQYINGWVDAGSHTSSAYIVNYQSDGTGNHAQYQLIAAAAIPTPEPSTLAIACLGVIGFVGYGVKRRRR